MVHRFRIVLGLLTVLGGLGMATPVHAGIFRAYLSVNGTDANPCTLPQPCRLLPAALAAVNDGGEIWMLDSANFNVASVTIGKSVAILAVPGALGSIVATGGNGIVVDAPGAKVALRNLVVMNLSGELNAGVIVSRVSSLTISGCEIYGLSSGVVISAGGSTVTVRDTTIRDNSSQGLRAEGLMKVHLRNVNVLNAVLGIVAANGVTMTVSDSHVAGNFSGIDAIADVASSTLVTVTRSTISGNSFGLRLLANPTATAASVMLNDSTVVHNATGVQMNASAQLLTRQNNTWTFNDVDIEGGVATAVAAR